MKNIFCKLLLAGLCAVSSVAAEYVVYKNDNGQPVAPTHGEYLAAYQIVCKYQFPRYVYAAESEISSAEKDALDRDEEAFLSQKIKECLGSQFCIKFIAPTLYELFLMAYFAYADDLDCMLADPSFLSKRTLPVRLWWRLDSDNQYHVNSFAIDKATTPLSVEVALKKMGYKGSDLGHVLAGNYGERSLQDIRCQMKEVALSAYLQQCDTMAAKDIFCGMAWVMNTFLVSRVCDIDRLGVAQRLIAILDQASRIKTCARSLGAGLEFFEPYKTWHALCAMKELILRAIQLEIDNRNCAIIYRGTNLEPVCELDRRGKNDTQVKSLSFGRTLLAGFLTDNRAMCVDADGHVMVDETCLEGDGATAFTYLCI